MWLSSSDIFDWKGEAPTCQSFHTADESCHANLLAGARVAILFDRIIVFHTLTPAPCPHRRVSGSALSNERDYSDILTQSTDCLFKVYSSYVTLPPLAVLQGEWICLYRTGFLTCTYASWCLVNVTVTNLPRALGALKICLSRSGLWCQIIQLLSYLMSLPLKGKKVSFAHLSRCYLRSIIAITGIKVPLAPGPFSEGFCCCQLLTWKDVTHLK